MKPDGRMDRRREASPNQALHLTGAAILVSRGIEVLQAAPADELCRCVNHNEIIEIEIIKRTQARYG